MPNSVQTARYPTTNNGTVRRRPLSRVRLTTAGVAPGSIMAAIIATQKAMKDANGPSWVAAPISIPFICRTATTQEAAASPSVAVRATSRSCTVSLRSCRSFGVGHEVVSPIASNARRTRGLGEVLITGLHRHGKGGGGRQSAQLRVATTGQWDVR